MLRPLIGITLRYEPDREQFYQLRYYSEAVETAGGLPVHLPLIPDSEYIRGVVARLDGVLLPGSLSDVDPLLYGRQPAPLLGDVHSLRDRTDLLVLAEVERRSLPLLAICYGLQILNVSRGGTLYQDIQSVVPNAIKHSQGGPRDRRSHGLHLVADSLVSRLAGSPESAVNSHHHQAVEMVGKNLRATALADDGVIEAIEDTREDRFAVGVQWHPELGYQTSALDFGLFVEFIERSRKGPGNIASKASATLQEPVPQRSGE